MDDSHLSGIVFMHTCNKHLIFESFFNDLNCARILDAVEVSSLPKKSIIVIC